MTVPEYPSRAYRIEQAKREADQAAADAERRRREAHERAVELTRGACMFAGFVLLALVGGVVHDWQQRKRRMARRQRLPMRRDAQGWVSSHGPWSLYWRAPAAQTRVPVPPPPRKGWVPYHGWAPIPLSENPTSRRAAAADATVQLRRRPDKSIARDRAPAACARCQPGPQRKESLMADEIEHEPLLTPGEVARMFRVHPRTVTRWARDGDLRSIRTLGGHIRFYAADVRAALEGGGQ